MTAKRDYSQKLYLTCLEFFLHDNQDYMTKDYQDRYMEILMLTMSVYGTLNEKLTKEHKDAENMAYEIRNCPVLRLFKE
jgi:hypothetical protein